MVWVSKTFHKHAGHFDDEAITEWLNLIGATSMYVVTLHDYWIVFALKPIE